MLLHFIGADHEVTGSCHLLEVNGRWIMIDRGMEQGKDIYENADLPCAPSDIDAIVLTHAHIDHSGLVPLMYAQGFKGKIYATRATCDLCDIMLRDSAHIQEFEAEWRNRKGQRQGKEPFIPLYTMADAMGAIELFEPKNYDTVYEIFPGIRIRFTDIGHLLGSSAIELWAEEDGQEVKIVFSGDVGNVDQPILKDPQTVEGADYLLIESTYGNRIHDRRVDYIERLVPIIQKTLDRGGNVVIPSFAVGRTQEMLYFLRQIKEQGLIKGHDGFPVVVDSPLANEATTVFGKNVADCFDEEALALVKQGINPIGFRGLQLSITSDDSIALNTDMTPKVILSASGMCEAGRIKHHLKHNVWRPESTILFVGYQAEGTLGRQLIDGAKEIKLFGESIAVAAETVELPGVSGHADKEGLLRWAKALNCVPKKTFVVHGEDTVCDEFAGTLHEELGHDALAPYSGAVYDLLKNEFLVQTEGIPIHKEVAEQSSSRLDGGHGSGFSKERIPSVDPNSVYGRLIAAGQRLMKVIEQMQGEPKKEIGQFLDQINDLADQWDDSDIKKEKKKK